MYKYYTGRSYFVKLLHSIVNLSDFCIRRLAARGIREPAYPFHDLFFVWQLLLLKAALFTSVKSAFQYWNG